MSQTFDPTIQTEDIAYRPDDLVACDACGRANPPNRTQCLYCASDLATEITGDHIKLALRHLEHWERGWNIIAVEGAASKDAADILYLDRNALDQMLSSRECLPIARVESEPIAAALVEKLAGHGIVCRAVSDEQLDADRPPTRLRHIEFEGPKLVLTAFNTGAATTIEWQDLVLLVDGSIVSGRTDSLEKKRRRHKEAKVIEATQTTSDEPVLDLYIRSDPTGFRIHPGGFDFSCLGGQKKLLAVENLSVLTEKLKLRVPGVQHRKSYRKIDHLLNEVWPLESRKDSKGLIAGGFGRREFGSVASTSNRSQFNRYSRLQWHLL